MGQQTVDGIATSYGYDGPGIKSSLDRPRRPLSSLYNKYRVSFLGIKRPERGDNQPPPSSAEVKDRVEPYLYSYSGPLWPVLGWTLHFSFINTDIPQDDEIWDVKMLWR